MLRGDLKWFFIMLITNIIIGVLTLGYGLIIPWVIFAFIYNGRHINDLGKKGYIEVRDYIPPSDTLPPGEYRIKPEGRPL